jgi:hypothetical protein
MKKLWLFETNSKGFDFSRSILIELISMFPITQKEGIDLINSFWKHQTLVEEYDIAYHETPEYWAKNFYWGKDEVWWKPEPERALIEPLKPKRLDLETEYELWESSETEEYVFISSVEINNLLNNELLDNSFKRTWGTTKLNYIEGLKELHKYKGWNVYKDIC